MSNDIVGSDRVRSSVVGVGLARRDAIPYHVADSKGFNSSIASKLKSTVQIWTGIEPYRRARLFILDENFITGILVNEYFTGFTNDGTAITRSIVTA